MPRDGQKKEKYGSLFLDQPDLVIAAIKQVLAGKV
jgi:hypothetical protein